MCGIAGFWSSRPIGMDRAHLAAQSMARTLVHRGPDDEGVWVDPDGSIALAHRRLAVVDLSAAGHQPMRSRCGRFEIVYNGEIYNHLALRRELGQEAWAGTSDTETVLAAVVRWGVAETLKRLVGMFAIALWDRERRRLVLARDRIGEKPLYYGFHAGALLFASELKAIAAWPGAALEVDRGAVALLLRHNYVPAPISIFRGIRKLSPGCWIELEDPTDASSPRAYWSMAGCLMQARSEPFEGTDSEAIDRLEGLIQQSVDLQRVADVPLGAFLSGGVDSSTIVALMQRGSTRPVRTFTIGFREAGFNEAEHAAAVARHLRTDHTELYVSGQDALDLVPRLPRMYCEPFADSSQVPTHLVAALARRHVTVALSGDAGDELFCGYTRYPLAARTWSRLSRVPTPMRRLGLRALLSTPPGWIDRGWRAFARMSGRRIASLTPSRHLHRTAALVQSDRPQAFYRGMISHLVDPQDWVNGAEEPLSILDCLDHAPEFGSFEESMMYIDLNSYLPDDILVKVDRAAMATSLETRVPLLDHRIVEFAWRLPLRFKQRDGVSKWLLRQVLYRHVPREMIDRPKTGFAIPLSAWLRGPLRDWAEHLLGESRLTQQGLLDVRRVRTMWQEQQRGEYEWMYPLWNILMLQAWIDEFGSRFGAAEPSSVQSTARPELADMASR